MSNFAGLRSSFNYSCGIWNTYKINDLAFQGDSPFNIFQTIGFTGTQMIIFFARCLKGLGFLTGFQNQFSFDSTTRASG